MSFVLLGPNINSSTWSAGVGRKEGRIIRVGRRDGGALLIAATITNRRVGALCSAETLHIFCRRES